MGRFWKEVVGGQVQTGVYQAGPRHASKQYGSFKTGRPPRLPFQFVVYFEVNPNVYAYVNSEGEKQQFLNNNDFYKYSSLVRAVDIPSVDFTVEKKNQYNKLKPIVTTKDFKPFTLTVYDDIESRWYALWQNYYNYYFMDGRFDVGDQVKGVRAKKADKDDKGNVIAGTAVEAVKAKGNDVANRNNNNEGIDLIPNNYTINTEGSPFNSDRNGMDIHGINRKNFFDAIHVFQIHADTVTRTTAVNPILTSAQVTQLDYASTGVPSEITFNIEYEKLAYGPILNYNYEEDDILKELIEDVTKAPVFDPSPDKLKGIVKGLLGLESRNSTRQQVVIHDAERDLEISQVPSILSAGGGTTQGGFFSNLISNAIDKKLNEATAGLFKKQNKNINKLNF